MKMTCDLHHQNEQALFVLAGEIHEKEAVELKKIFETLHLSSIKEAIFDFGGVRFLGSTAMGNLLIFFRRLAVNQGKMRLINTPPTIAALLRELKLDTLFTIE